MCRVAVRNNARARSPDPNPAPALPPEQLPTLPKEQELNFAELFDGDDDVGVGAANQPVNVQENEEAVLGQPVTEVTSTETVMGCNGLLPQTNFQPIQFQTAIMQPQAPTMLSSQGNFLPPLQQQYTQAILQQQMLAMQRAAVSGGTAINKRGKTAQEVAEQQERIKRRRRESAQRSRQRKSCYMKTLECENHALKLENDRLRKELERIAGQATGPLFASLTTSGSNANIKDESDDGPLCGLFASDSNPASDGNLCQVDASGLGNPAAQEFMGMVI